MAYLATFKCSACDQPKSELIGSGKPTPTICGDCQTKQAQEKRHAFLAELQALPVADRLARLEAWAYDFDAKWIEVLSAVSRDHARY